MILNQASLSESEVKLLVTAANSVYQNQMSLDGWQVITPDLTNPNYGLNPALITGNTFKAEGDFLNLPFGDANAAVLKSGDNLLLAFRGTLIPEGDASYWLRLEEHYDLFEPLFKALDNYIQTNPASKILVTGHSLGAAMAEFYMAKHPGALYSAVTLASPTASNDPTDTRILNVGFENDPVYEITSGDPFGVGNGGANPSNSTTNLFLDLDAPGSFGINNHAASEYVYAVKRLFDSVYYDQIKRDSFVMIDRKNSNVNVSDVVQSTDKNVFLLGEDNKADDMKGDQKDDILEGLGGNDTLKGDLISASFFSGNDTLDGGKGNDSLDGGKGEDKAVFTDNFENYDAQTSGILTKTTTITHKNNGVDGIDTLQNIEWGEFTNKTVPIGNARLATDPAPRIIPLPLEDGVLDTEAVKATDNTVNPNLNDPPTPPYVSLTAPVAMLDGNVDYTLNISPYKPNTQFNILYIFDTNYDVGSITSTTKLQQAKSAYTNLTNYFVDNGLAENVNFGIVTFNNTATLQTDAQGDRNFTAAEAIAKIQSLTATTGVGRNYKAALDLGFDFLSTSPLKPSTATNPDRTTSISYFFSDNANTQSISDRGQMQFAAKTLRKFSTVQAFGLTGVVNGANSDDINFIDSNNGVLMPTSADLSTELGKSGLADTVTAVNIRVDGVLVDTIQPSELIDSPLGLTYKGSLDKLDVSAKGKNVITAEAVFNNSTAPTTANFTVTAGSGKLTDASGTPLAEPPLGNDEDPFKRIRNGGTGNDDITLGYVDQGASGGAGDDYIVGNKRDNQLDGGDGNDIIIGHEGNDTIITGAGTNKVTGGAGIDTVLYGNVAFPGATSLRQAANSVLYNNTDTLTEVEYLQFSDVRISAKTFAVVPILNAADVSITEGDSGTKTAQFTFNLSNPAPGNVTFNYSTADLDAVAGTDYVAQLGQVNIPAGQTSASVSFTINGDTTYEANETFGLTLSGISGATFKDNVTEYNAIVTIANDDPVNYPPFSLGIPNTITTTNPPNQSINLAQAFQDLEDTNLTYSVQNNTNSTLFDAVTVDQANKILLLDYKASTTGNSALTVRATDSKGLFVDTTFNVSAIAATSNNDTIAGGDSADYLDGGAGNDSLSGLGKDDTLTGGAGNDALIGGAGNDLYIVDPSTDTITENANEGIDTVSSSVAYILGATSNLENITLTGTSVINATGNSLDNKIIGNSATNGIAGGTGNDTMTGGAGNDTYTVDATGDVVIESNTPSEFDTVRSSVNYTLSDNVERLTLIDTSAINGTGNSLNNTITGNGAANIISGGAGNDTMTGGTGNDTYVVDVTGDVVTETSTLTTEIDTVQSGASYTLSTNVENLTLTGTSAINGIGNNLNNAITGNSAANSINGGVGNDTMTGGAGNDTYVVGSAGDVVNETSVLTTEIDTVQSGISYALATNVERLTLIGTSAINGSGNGLNNTVTGNSAANTLFGGIGTDTIAGGLGDDLLIGASGNDSLTGGDGSDRFLYDTNVAFASNAVGIDRINDFVSGTDKLILDKTTFTALTSIAGNGFSLANEFAVVGSDAAASTSSALIVYSSETDNLFYNQNGVTSGLGSGAQLATLSGITTLSPSDFELQV